VFLEQKSGGGGGGKKKHAYPCAANATESWKAFSNAITGKKDFKRPSAKGVAKLSQTYARKKQKGKNEKKGVLFAGKEICSTSEI